MKPLKITPRNIMFISPTEDFNLNTGLILGGRFNYIIDTGLGSGSAAPVREYIEKAYGNGTRPQGKKPLIVINTHYHWDHVWGNCAFKDGIIIAHALCPDMIVKDWDRAVRKYGGLADGDAAMRLPDMTFNDCLYFPDDGIKIFHTPGHSADCISVYDEKDKVLYAGDNIGDTDGEIVPYIGTDTQTYRKTIDIYASYDFVLCVTGHSRPRQKDIIDSIKAALG